MIERYTHDKHYDMVKQWLFFRGMGVPEKDMFSSYGLCVNNAAIGFLFLTNSKQAYIDNIAANPEKTEAERDHSLTTLIKALELAAIEKGSTFVSVLANIPTMKKRFVWSGYKKHNDYSLFYKNIGG